MPPRAGEGCFEQSGGKLGSLMHLSFASIFFKINML